MVLLSSYSGDYAGLSSQIPEFNSPWERLHLGWCEHRRARDVKYLSAQWPMV